MLLGCPLNVFEKTYFIQVNISKDNYIKINNDEYYTNSSKTFKYFEFKLNKRGGESGHIEFVKPFGEYKIGDAVEVKINGQKIFYGVIEKVTDFGRSIDVIPMWGKLGWVYITDTLVFEETQGIYELLLSMADKIRESGVKFNPHLIEIPQNQNMVKYNITTEMGGKSVLEILEEIEEELPSSYNFGVDAGGTFYFKSFKESAQYKLDWYQGDFNHSSVDLDYSELYSQYVVKHKRYNALGESEDAYDVLKWIVGSDQVINGVKNPYPVIPALQDAVGVKTKTFEYNFQSDEQEAYEYAYDLLKRQVPIEAVDIKDFNYKRKRVEINDCVDITMKPTENFYVDFILGYASYKTISNHVGGGELMKVGLPVGYSKEVNGFMGILDLNKQPGYLEICNRTLDISELIVYYYSSQSTNKFYVRDNYGNFKTVYSGGGRLVVDLRGFNKRSVLITSEAKAVVYYKARAFFSQGSDLKTMNIREIKYKYESGVTSVDLRLAKLNTVLTGYMHAQNKRLETLEDLLSS